MKKLVFRKVKIVKAYENHEGFAYVVNPDSHRKAMRMLNRQFDHEYDLNNVAERPKKFNQLIERHNKRVDAYNKTLKRWDTQHKDRIVVKWKIVDLDTGDTMKTCDSYQEAKQLCIKNDYDFGQYE